jgi:DNA repair protein RecO (recombination protein O)
MSILPQPVASGDAVVLRVWPSGETSAVASLLTREHGFVKVIAKGARTARSPLRSLVQPGRLIQADYGLAAARELQYLRGGELVLDPLAAAARLETHAYLLAALELADLCRHGPGGEPGARRAADAASPVAGEDTLSLFTLCEGFLRVLSSPPHGSECARFYAFELSLLSRLGIAPVLDECTVCGRSAAVVELPWFSPAHGGLVCAACGGVPDARPISPRVATRLRELGPVPPAAWPSVALAAAERRECGILLHRFLGYHLPGYRLPAALDMLRPAAERNGRRSEQEEEDPG